MASTASDPAPIAPLAAIAAAALPSLLAYNVAPSPTFLNQALAHGLWAGFILAACAHLAWRGAGPVFASLLMLALAAAVSVQIGSLPATLALSALATLVAAAIVLAGGVGARSLAGAGSATGVPGDPFVAFCWGWVAAGALNVVVAAIQVFFPDLPDGTWIAHSGFPGRAVGNLRQPNHLSSLLLWSCIATVLLLQLGRLRRLTGALLFAALVFAVVLTASRTGLVSVLLLAVWGGVDRRLHRPARSLLLAAPLIYALTWLAMAQWAALSAHSFGGTERLAETDISSSRFAIWRDTLALIRMQPWTGVGFGEFNFAWALTPFPNRPTALFDHTHNLPLQFAVELGLPLAALVCGLLLWSLWRGFARAWTAPGDAGSSQRSAMMMVLMIGLHSLLEYPLWYSYFLLPAAWAWGYALGPANAPAGRSASGPAQVPLVTALAGLAMIAGAALSVFDYGRVAAIFSAGDGDRPLALRIAEGQRSLLFGHHADYAAATSGLAVPGADPVRGFDRATHYLLDTRLMIAWANALAQRGDIDAARHVAARLREFRKADAEEFFAACPRAASDPAPGLPYQCERPERELGWRAFQSR